ncbi:MAG: O-antigen ligase family protein [Bacteroidales bacterium]
MKQAKKRNIKTPKTTNKNKLSVSAIILVLGLVILMPLVKFKITIDPTFYPRFAILSFVLLLLTFTIKPIHVLYVFRQKGLFRIFLIVLLVFIAFTLLLLFFAVNPIEGLADLFKWIMFLILVVYAYHIFTTAPNAMIVLVKAVVINSLIAFAVGIYQFLNLSFTEQNPNIVYEVTGLMAHKNQFSFALFLLLPFLAHGILILDRVWRKLAILGLLSALILIVGIQTRAAWMAMFFAGLTMFLIVLLINRKKQLINFQHRLVKRIAILIAGLSVVLVLALFLVPEKGPVGKIKSRITSVVDPEYASNTWRLEMWQATIEMIRDYPIVGVGGGNWKITIYPYYSKYLPSIYRHWRNVHNDYLEILAEKGIIGLLLFISMLALVLFRGFRFLFSSNNKIRQWQMIFYLFCLIGALVIFFFSFPLERINQVVFIAIQFAMIFSFGNEGARENNPIIKKRGLFIQLPIAVVLLMILIFSIQVTNSEINIGIAKAARDKGLWHEVKKYAEKGDYKFAPLLPQYSFPVVMYRGLGSFHSDRDFKEALRFFEIAHKQHPTSVTVLNNMGAAAGQSGDIEATIKYHQKSLEIYPHYEFGLLNLAKAYYLKEDYETAYKVILSCNPGSVNQEVGKIRLMIENKLPKF